MFEDYLEDSYDFSIKAREAGNEREAKRYYRGAIFYAASALEAFINYIGDSFEQAGVLQKYELAFITDRKFGYDKGHIGILAGSEFHRLEDKLRFLLSRFVPAFDIATNPAWSNFIEFKKLRDSIIHPRNAEDEIDLPVYKKLLTSGLSSIITIIDELCRGMFKKPLRQRLLDLS
jgi:hypothetical protein